MGEYTFSEGLQLANSVSPRAAYIKDILEQPDALQAGLLAWTRLDAEPVIRRIRESPRVILTGMGSSYSALWPAWRLLVKSGIAAWHLDTAELLALGPEMLRRDTLIIAASQSGRSAELVTLNRLALGRSPIVAIVNDPESPLAQDAAQVLELHSGAELTVSTRSYLNTLALASILGTATCGGGGKSAWQDALSPWMSAPETINRYVERWRIRVEAIKNALGSPDRLVLLGRGDSLAATSYGALIIKEGAKWPVEAMNAAQFRHGPLELADARLTAIIVAGAETTDRERNMRLAVDIQRFGGRAVWLGGPAGVPLPSQARPPAETLATIEEPAIAPQAHCAAEMLPMQMLSIALAEMSGIEPGVFRHLEKVTAVE